MNKKYFYDSALLVLFSIFLVGFGFGSPKFDAKNPENSLSKMTSEMSIEEEGLLIKDIDLLILLFKNENKINGYTVERIKSEARKLREALIERNIKFLKLKIAEIESEGKNSTSLMIEKSIFFSNPKVGYVPKSYSINNLKQRLAWLMTADASRINPDGTNILTEKLDPINIDIVNQVLSTETTARAAEEAAQARAAEEAAQAQAQAQAAEEANLLDPEATDLRRCYLEVVGKIYMDNPCKGYLNDNDDGFQISSPEYFAVVQIYEDGAIGSWNEEAYATHAHSDLGLMTKSGPCWKSDKATICFWK